MSNKNEPKVGEKKNIYVLDMFPYPSGEGLHVGHPKGYIATDIYSRFKKMNGYNVVHPMGWDAFGLPAEQFALKNKTHPKAQTEKNVANFKKQLEKINLDYDWDREISTTDPKFYKWTQWIFKQLYKNGLAYESFEPINWCPSCKTGLANEDLEGNACERCGTIVEKKPLRQWNLAITKYADRLIDDLDTLTLWPEWVKTAQKNWIGRSEGSEIEFKVVGGDKNIKFNESETIGLVGYGTSINMSVSHKYESKFQIFTTRADTLFGCTYTVLAPEHKLVREFLDKNMITNKEEVEKYLSGVKTKTDIERSAEGREKTGVRLDGVMAINPANNKEVPIYIADYVLASYGTGAIMAVPAHDERDYEFAIKYNIEIDNSEVIDTNEERKRMTNFVGGKLVTKYKLREWVFARQRYWGEPFPIVFDEDHKSYVVADSELPILLPDVESYEPTGTGESPLANIKSFTDVYGYINDDGEFESVHNHFKDIIEVGTPLPDSKEVSGSTVIAYDKNKNLFLKLKNLNNNSTWLPSGGINDGESYEECALRELREEAGIVKVEKIISLGAPIVSYYFNPNKNSNRKSFGHNYLCYADSDQVLSYDNEEGEKFEAEWVNYEELLASLESEHIDNSHWILALKRAKTIIDLNKEIKLFKRETNTMPQWAGSSWYYLRFLDPNNNEALIDPSKERAYRGLNADGSEGGTVDLYVGGDHATRHLIYARFWHKFLYDIGVVSTLEPFKRLEFLGFILAEDGRKMSKRWGNIINPDDIVAEYGSDTLRVYEMFMAPFEATAVWNTSSIKGVKRFLERVDRLKNRLVITKKQNVKLVGEGAFGKIYEGLTDAEAEEFILKMKEGEMVSAYHYKDLGGVDLVWGKYDEATQEGYGLAKISKKHPEVLGTIQKLLDTLPEFSRDENRIKLSDEKSHVTISLDWFGQRKVWLLTSFLKDGELQQEKPSFEGLPITMGLRQFNSLDLSNIISETESLSNSSCANHSIIHQTIKKVTNDIENFKFNTCVSQLMICLNEFEEKGCSQEECDKFMTILFPFAPTLAVEYKDHKWPEWDENKLQASTATIALQINGKMRGTFDIVLNASEEDIKAYIKTLDIYKKYVVDENGKEIEPKKIIIVKNKIVNVVV